MGRQLRWRGWTILLVWLCAACAGPDAKYPALPADEVAAEKRRQEVAQLRDYYSQLHRVNSVAYRLRTANRDACKDWLSVHLGLVAATPRSLPRKFQSFSAEALGLRWVRPTVISVAEGSPAGLAGIVDRDELLSFNGEPVPVYGTSKWMADFAETYGERPLTVAFLRDGEHKTAVLNPVIGCAIPVTLEINPEPGAFTDYSKIVIHSGMLRLTKSEGDLAVVMGHELAHVTMGHHHKQKLNGVIGAFGGAAIDGGFLLGGIGTGGAFTKRLYETGLMAFSVAFEREADYVGAYYAVRAGYDISGAENIWRAFSLEIPASIRVATTHPTTPARYVQLRKAIKEIAEKKKKNSPLTPELRFVRADAEPEVPARERND